MSTEEIEAQQEINRKSLKRAKEEMKKVKKLLNKQNAKKATTQPAKKRARQS